jgi:hypothetical protein
MRKISILKAIDLAVATNPDLDRLDKRNSLCHYVQSILGRPVKYESVTRAQRKRWQNNRERLLQIGG